MKKRIIELDSLRGLAAISVVIGHYLGIYEVFASNTQELGMNSLVNWVKYTPLHIIYAGHEAVLLFFILSGFVLSLPYLTGNKQNLISFYIKRIFRIYVPVIVMVILALIARSAFYNESSFIGLSPWINSKWGKPIDLRMLLEHITLIFNMFILMVLTLFCGHSLMNYVSI